jgi:hypothetical protein
MPSLSDLLEAKAVLGGRYLRRGMCDGVMRISFANRVSAAVNRFADVAIVTCGDE